MRTQLLVAIMLLMLVLLAMRLLLVTRLLLAMRLPPETRLLVMRLMEVLPLVVPKVMRQQLQEMKQNHWN